MASNSLGSTISSVLGMFASGGAGLALVDGLLATHGVAPIDPVVAAGLGLFGAITSFLSHIHAKNTIDTQNVAVTSAQ